MSPGGPAPVRVKAESGGAFHGGRRGGGRSGGMRSWSGLHHLYSSDRDHDTGQPGLLGVQREVAEEAVRRLEARITLRSRKSKSGWK